MAAGSRSHAAGPHGLRPERYGAPRVLFVAKERFCSGFADRDTEAVMSLFAPDPDVIVVTSEESLLRGPVELKRFLDRYAEVSATYSWEWNHFDLSAAGSVGWLLAEGSETAAAEERLEQYPYRMTMVCERREGRWLLMQLHGSSPH